jgi:type II secretory pathway pseudopilin PulG
MMVDRVKPRRRGLTAVAVLVCLIVIAIISGALLKVGIAHRDQVRSQEHKLQAEWLAQSGIDRALARLAAKPDYTGETWELATGDLDLPAASSPQTAPAAVVVIKVERPPGPRGSEARLIKVQADYPPDLPRRVRHSLQILVELNSLKTGVSR